MFGLPLITVGVYGIALIIILFLLLLWAYRFREAA